MFTISKYIFINTIEKNTSAYASVLIFVRIRQGDIPASPNKGDGCPFRPQYSYLFILHLHNNIYSYFFQYFNKVFFFRKLYTRLLLTTYNDLTKNLLPFDTLTATFTNSLSILNSFMYSIELSFLFIPI